MNGWLLALVGLIYFCVAVGFWRELGRWDAKYDALIFVGYTIAQLGFVLKVFRI